MIGSSAGAAGDFIQPFQVERYGLRGRMVRIGAVADDVLGRHDYPPPVALMLGEMMAVAATLAGALKYDGVFTLQMQGDGPIRLMVTDVTSAGEMRAYAQYDAERLAKLLAAAPNRDVGDSVPQLLGAGYLAFTVDQGPDTERYQGIVDLDGATLAECVHHYFRQSEQIEAAIKVAVGRKGGGWQVGALMIQRLPKIGGLVAGDDSRYLSEDEREEGWREAVVLMGSATSGEMTDAGLPPERLLYRLFHEPGVRVFKPIALTSGCRCSRERVAGMLRSFPKDEIVSMMVEGRVEVTCEFCRRAYSFDRAMLEGLFAGRG